MSEQSYDLIGQTIGQYTIRKLLGQGGMATVYLADQESIGRQVAVKVMPAHFMNEPNFLERFKREVAVIAKLQHPHILPVYDYGEFKGRPYIVMAYLEGGTLSERIKQGPLPLSDVVRIVGQMAEALDFAHREGIIHRDFKPSNILIDRNGNAYLADFGIAKISAATVQLTGSGVVGTPAYMAPEMANEGEVSPLVDIYALGVTLYEMLTGHFPFQADTPLRVMMAHATSPVPDVRNERPELPEGVSQVVKKAMAKNPADRYAKASDLAEDLRAAVAGQPISVEEPSATIVAPDLESTVAEPSPLQTSPPPGAWMAPSEAKPSRRETEAVAVPMPTAAERKAGPPWGLIIGIIVGALVLCCGSGLAIYFGTSLLAPAPTATPLPTDTPIPTLPPPPSPTLPPTAVPVTGPSVVVNNQSGETICYLYISPSSSDSWGQNRLGTDTLPTGSSFTVSGLLPDTYDLLARDCSQDDIDQHYSVTLNGSMSYNWDIQPLVASLTLINNSSYNICELYISHSTDETWGLNFLGEDNVVVASGSRHTVDRLPIGTYDLRAVTCDEQSVERYDELLDGPTEWTITD